MKPEEFEWDQSKSAENRRLRGFGFDLAARIFEGDVMEREDWRRDYGEPRIVATGQVNS